MITKNKALIELNISIEFDAKKDENLENAARTEASNYVVIDKRTGSEIEACVVTNKSWINT